MAYQILENFVPVLSQRRSPWIRRVSVDAAALRRSCGARRGDRGFRLSSLRRGNATVSIDWDACGASKVVLEAGSEGPLTLRSTLFEKPYDVAFDKENKPRSLATQGQTFTFHARRGGVYTFKRDESVNCASDAA